MPEGDTIYRAAHTLRQVLAGKEILSARSDVLDAASLVGRTVSAVEPHGKHMLIHFDDGRALHTHMRMTGSWHIYRPGESWQKDARGARVVLATHDWLAVCFHAPVVRLVDSGQAKRVAMRLGPDVLADGFDPVAAARSLRSMNHRPIGEAVMRQTRVAGIGNVYKSELLFIARISPFTPVAEVPDEALVALMDSARRLMTANLTTNKRVTRGGSSRVWVYRRQGSPCFECGTLIRMRRQGEDGRSTYFCPKCQPRATR